MEGKTTYNTKQLQLILQVLKNHEREYISIANIINDLKKMGYSLGISTVYRQLKNLETQGLVTGAKLAHTNCISYCYKPKDEASEKEVGPYYLQCEDCGKIILFDCHQISHLYDHVKADHNFSVNPSKTIFYGHCGCKNHH